MKKLLKVQQFFNKHCYCYMKDIHIHTLGYYVDRTFTHMVKFLNYELGAAGLNLQHPQFAILMVVAHNEGISQALLTEYVGRDKASVSRNVRYLEKEGYIVRESADGKQKNIILTEKGRKILPLLHEISQKDTDFTLRGFTENQKKEVYKILEKMYINISCSIENKNQ